jgi:hypothetical protein
VTVWVERARRFEGDARVLFEQPIITVADRKRVGLVLPVGELSDFLRTAGAQGIEVEHIYDY